MNFDLEMIPLDELTLNPPPVWGQTSLKKRVTKALLLFPREGDRG